MSRTATAPIDRLKMLLQIQDCQRGLTIMEGVGKMSSEGAKAAGVGLSGGRKAGVPLHQQHV